jgi:hypothetical protein
MNIFRIYILLLLLVVGCTSEKQRLPLYGLTEHEDEQYGSIFKARTISGEVEPFTGIAVDSVYDERQVIEIDVEKGIMNGGFFIRNYNGDILVKGQMRNGKKEGTFKEYFDNGKLSRESAFKNDLQHGKVVLYYENGKKRMEGTYVEGERDGLWTWYDEQGKVENTQENKAFRNEIVSCTCCNNTFNNREGWSAIPQYLDETWQEYYPLQEKGGIFCSRECAIKCGS